MKEGILVEQKGKIFPYDKLISALYGFNNKYGAICRIAEGGIDPTKKGEDIERDIIELKILGITVPPEDLFNMPQNHVKYLIDQIIEEDYLMLMSRLEKELKNLKEKKYNEEKGIFECLNIQETKEILKILRDLPERKAVRSVSDSIMLDVYEEKRKNYSLKDIEI